MACRIKGLHSQLICQSIQSWASKPARRDLETMISMLLVQWGLSSEHSQSSIPSFLATVMKLLDMRKAKNIRLTSPKEIPVPRTVAACEGGSMKLGNRPAGGVPKGIVAGSSPGGIWNAIGVKNEWCQLEQRKHSVDWAHEERRRCIYIDLRGRIACS